MRSRCWPTRPAARASGAWAALRRAVAERPPWLEALPGDAAAPARRASPASRRASGCAASGCRSRCCSSARSPHTGYDLAILARAGGDRRLANLRKLMRLAREYERAEGRDLRGFLAYAVGQDLAEAREGEAALESEGLDAVRLMTIHRAKGLEFPVVCVADLGRTGAPRPRPAADRRGRRRRAQAAHARRRRAGAGARLGADRRRAGRGRGGRGAAAALRRRHARGGAADPLGRHRHREVARRRAAARRRSTGSRRRCSASGGPIPADATVSLRRRGASPSGCSRPRPACRRARAARAAQLRRAPRCPPSRR